MENSGDAAARSAFGLSTSDVPQPHVPAPVLDGDADTLPASRQHLSESGAAEAVTSEAKVRSWLTELPVAPEQEAAGPSLTKQSLSSPESVSARRAPRKRPRIIGRAILPAVLPHVSLTLCDAVSCAPPFPAAVRTRRRAPPALATPPSSEPRCALPSPPAESGRATDPRGTLLFSTPPSSLLPALAGGGGCALPRGGPRPL